MSDGYETILYSASGPVATITLNRPDRLNTIVPPMPEEVQGAVGTAIRDAEVKVIVLRGAGRAFCAGYDFGGGFEHWGDALETDGRWDPGKDFTFATAQEVAPTQQFMSVWRSPKPVIAQVHGWCVGGGSDFALCADLVVASEDAVIGTPYSDARARARRDHAQHPRGPGVRGASRAGRRARGGAGPRRALRGLQPGAGGAAAGPGQRDRALAPQRV